MNTCDCYTRIEIKGESAIEDAEGRLAAYERLLYALQGAVNPWETEIKKKAAFYQPIAIIEQKGEAQPA